MKILNFVDFKNHLFYFLQIFSHIGFVLVFLKF